MGVVDRLFHMLFSLLQEDKIRKDLLKFTHYASTWIQTLKKLKRYVSCSMQTAIVENRVVQKDNWQGCPTGWSSIRILSAFRWGNVLHRVYNPEWHNYSPAANVSVNCMSSLKTSRRPNCGVGVLLYFYWTFIRTKSTGLLLKSIPVWKCMCYCFQSLLLLYITLTY